MHCMRKALKETPTRNQRERQGMLRTKKKSMQIIKEAMEKWKRKLPRTRAWFYIIPYNTIP